VSRVIEAIFKDGQVRPLEPIDLPDETRLRIIVEEEDEAGGRAAASNGGDPLATIYEIAEEAGPADLSVNLDHYLYGLPKRQ
jgi:predicted DNA-binding antitoxin AbrB/MazE fold protein